MKKRMIMAGALAAALLSGCGEKISDPSATCPTHVPGAYGWNATEHWQECACGQKMNAQRHDVSDATKCCAVCRVKIEEDEYDTSVIVVSSYDDRYNLMTRDKYRGRDHLSHSEYGYNADGEHVPIMHTSYWDDGGKSIYEYDEHGNNTYSVSYDSRGKIENESWDEYALNEDGTYDLLSSYEVGNSYDGEYELWVEYGIDDGWPYYKQYTSVYGDGRKIHEEYLDSLSKTLHEEYDAKGNLTLSQSWGYDDDGNEIWYKEYRDGVLVCEVTDYMEWYYKEYGVTFRRAEFRINYDADGTQLVTYCTYYEDDGSIKTEKTYDGDRLVNEKEYGEVYAGGNYVVSEISYHENGMKTVTTYGAYEELISKITYDAEGNEIG